MPLIFIHPSQVVTDTIQAGLHEIARNQQFRVKSLVAATPAQITLDSAHPVYNLGLDQIVAGVELESLIQTNWRFIVHRDGNSVAAAETQASGSASQLASVNSGPFVDGTVTALQALGQDPALAGGDWEVRLLRIPAIYVVAVWLHERNRGDNLIRALQPAPAYLDTTRSYRWDDFKAALTGAASDRLHFDDRPRP